MKRNWDTIREILVKVEGCTSPTEMIQLSDFPSERHAEFSYHMILLIESGLVSGTVHQSIGPEVKGFFARRLTWEGHEFLDSIRSDTVWKKTKEKFTEQGLSMTFDLVKEAVKHVGSAILIATGGS